MENQKTPGRPKSPHRQFVDFFVATVERTRGFKPPINGPRDGATLKRLLEHKGVSLDMLEKLALYFLASHRFEKVSPTISVFLSAGILTSLWNTMLNNPQFWKELDGYASAHMGKPSTVDRSEFKGQLEELRNLRAGLSKSFSA